METIKYIMTGKMVVSGKTKMSVTEQRSLNKLCGGHVTLPPINQVGATRAWVMNGFG
jgi:hypothetical protein